MLRNDNDFSPKFWDDIARVSRINQNFNRSSATAEGRIKVQALSCICRLADTVSIVNNYVASYTSFAATFAASHNAKDVSQSALPCRDLFPQAELEDQVWISTSFEDLCDQNVIVYLLRVKRKEYMPQVGISMCDHCPQGTAVAGF